MKVGTAVFLRRLFGAAAIKLLLDSTERDGVMIIRVVGANENDVDGSVSSRARMNNIVPTNNCNEPANPRPKKARIRRQNKADDD